MSKIFLVSLFFAVELFSCASFWQPTYIKEADYNFIDSSFLGQDAKNPLYKYAHISPWAYDDRVAYYQKIKKELNLKEWSSFFGISKKDALDIVYGDKKPLMIKDKQKKDEFTAYKKLLDCECEERELLEKFFSLYRQSKSDFFKTRTAYNIVKIYHDLKEYDKELKFIKSLKKTDSIVWEWINSYKAGALQRRGKTVASAYLFAKVFATHKSDNYIGYYDFKIKTDKQWQELLKLAKSDEEKTLFHFLRAINPKNNELLELKYMTKIDKNSKWVKRLLYLVAQKVQFRVFVLKNKDYQDYYDFKKEDLQSYIDDFMEYLKNYHECDLNQNLFAYFEYIYHDKRLAVKDTKEQKLLDYLYYVDSLKSIDEKTVSQKLLSVEKSFLGSDIVKSLRKYTLVKLSKLYPKGSLKQKLAGYYKNYDRYFDGFDFRSALTLKTLNGFVKLKNKKKKTYIEKLMLSSKEINLSKNYLKVYYGVLYTKAGEFKKALSYVKDLTVPKELDDIYNWDEKDRMRVSRFNPFNVKFSGDNRSYPYTKYSHKKFLKTILKIKKQLKQNPNSVMDNFLLANAWYNISDFGNSPMFATIYRCTTCIDEDSLEFLKKSEKLYKKVLKLTKNRELKAKIYYQLLKISLDKQMIKESKKDRYYSKPRFEDMGSIYQLIEKNSEYDRLYHKFEKNYKDTKFFKKVNGCATFRYFK